MENNRNPPRRRRPPVVKLHSTHPSFPSPPFFLSIKGSNRPSVPREDGSGGVRSICGFSILSRPPPNPLSLSSFTLSSRVFSSYSPFFRKGNRRPTIFSPRWSLARNALPFSLSLSLPLVKYFHEFVIYRIGAETADPTA